MNINEIILSFGLLIIAMTVHEFAHAFVAYLLGDTTAKHTGRLTLNPLAHIDPIGTILLPLFLFIQTQGRFVFGAAKPVPINYLALKNPKRDMIWIGISGPAANFLIAAATALIFHFTPMPMKLASLVVYFIQINVFLGTFNLVPLPPLDGSRVMMGLLPKEIARGYAMIEPYGFMIIMALMFLTPFGTLISIISGLILRSLGVSY